MKDTSKIPVRTLRQIDKVIEAAQQLAKTMPDDPPPKLKTGMEPGDEGPDPADHWKK